MEIVSMQFALELQQKIVYHLMVDLPLGML